MDNAKEKLPCPTFQQAWAGYKLSSTVMEKLQKVNKNMRENQWSIENPCIITITENTQFDVDVVTVKIIGRLEKWVKMPKAAVAYQIIFENKIEKFSLAPVVFWGGGFSSNSKSKQAWTGYKLRKFRRDGKNNQIQCMKNKKSTDTAVETCEMYN